MKKYLIGGVAGLIVGVLVTGLIISNAAPSMMIMEDESKFGDFDQTVAAFEESVKVHGWKMPAVHDLQKTMKKLGKSEVKAVKVFELCHPDHAHKILEKDDERVVTSLMPCRVAIYERTDGKVYVSRMNSGLMASFMDGVIPEVMSDASAENEEILKPIIK
jgi:uncharacterized protein (DUF302 family)